MSHDGPVQSASSNRLVIRNIGLLLSGDLDHPILDADTVVAIDGIIRAVGKEKDRSLPAEHETGCKLRQPAKEHRGSDAIR